MTTWDDEDILTALEQKFAPFTAQLIQTLQDQTFIFQEQKDAHLLHIDERLIIRHALPYCITEDLYFKLDERYIPFFSAVIMLHSLALTKIDDYYDGGHKTKSPIKQLTVDSLAYSLGITYEAMMRLLDLTPDTKELAKLLNITNFVHSRMYKDSVERYKTMCLEASQHALDTYLYGPHSRLLGSGYYEVMARASFVQRGEQFPEYLHELDIKLRKYRQIIDELEDVEQDLRAGLVTLPVLHMLLKHKHSRQIRKTILQSWEDDLLDTTSIRRALNETNTYQWINEEATKLYKSAMTDIDCKFRNSGDGYRTLFNFKKAKLDSLVGFYS
jgi:hypothetical protein